MSHLRTLRAVSLSPHTRTSTRVALPTSRDRPGASAYLRPPLPTSRTLRCLVSSTLPSCGLSLPTHPDSYSGGLAEVTRPTTSIWFYQSAITIRHPPPTTTKAAFYGSLVRSDNRIRRFTSFRDLARASYRAHPDICHHYSPSRSGRRCTVPNSFYGSLVRSDYRIRRLSLFRAIARPRACTASCPPRHLPPEIPIPLRPVLHLTVLFLRTPRAFRLPMPTPASIAPALLPSAR